MTFLLNFQKDVFLFNKNLGFLNTFSSILLNWMKNYFIQFHFFFINNPSKCFTCETQLQSTQHFEEMQVQSTKYLSARPLGLAALCLSKDKHRESASFPVNRKSVERGFNSFNALQTKKFQNISSVKKIFNFHDNRKVNFSGFLTLYDYSVFNSI
jgi:hypothetical protein